VATTATGALAQVQFGINLGRYKPQPPDRDRRIAVARSVLMANSISSP
jgi:hypothetical protein